MATKTVKFDRKGIRTLLKGIEGPIKDIHRYFILIGLKVDQSTQQTFRNQGARDGHGRWTGLNRGRGIGDKGSTTRTKLGTWNIRYGTDKNPKRTASALRAYKTKNKLWYKPGKMRGYESQRRYSVGSKVLQASGQFRKSFRILKVTNDQMVYGTRHKLAEKIMSDPKRQVLFVTERDKDKWGREFVVFYNRKLKF